MKNEFYMHKKSDKVKWVFTGIAFVLVFVLLAGVCMQLFGTGKVKPSEWFKKPDIEQTTPVENEDEIGGEAVITDKTANGGISLMTTSISPANYEDYGVSALAETAYTITATVTPADATFKEVTWSVSWANASSSWASGKNITDYISLNSNGLTATVACNQAFGEQAIVRVVSNDNASVFATCTLDYAARLSFANFRATSEIYDHEEGIDQGGGYSLYYTSSTAQTARYEVIYYEDNYSQTSFSFSGVYGTGTVHDFDFNNNFTLTFGVANNVKNSVNSALGINSTTIEISEYGSSQKYDFQNMFSVIFGSAFTSNRSQLYNTLQNYYTNNQAQFEFTLSFVGAYSGQRYTYTYPLRVDCSALYIRATNINMNNSSFVF